MVGSAFIVYDNKWACTNDAAIDNYTETIRDPAGKIQFIKKWQVFNMIALYGEKPLPDQLVDIVFKLEDINTVLSFKGRVQSVGELTIINILEKTDEIKKILSKITLKN